MENWTVSEGEECTYLFTLNLGQGALVQDHVKSGTGHNDGVAEIAKHDGEQEGERDDCKQPRVDFAIIGNTVGIHDSLEAFGKLVGAVEGGRLAVGHDLVEDGGKRGLGILIC